MPIQINTNVTPAAKSVWVRWLPNALPATGYITFDNTADKSYDITKIISPDYQITRIYETVEDGGTMKRVKRDKVTVPAKGQLPFVPGLRHITLERPTRLINPGDNASVLFVLDDGTVVKVKMPVRTSPELY